MPNFSNTAGAFDGSEANECFIDDIMAKAAQGHQLVFGKHKDHFYLFDFPKERPANAYVKHMTPLPTDPETKNCYWAEDISLAVAVQIPMYKWPDSEKQKNTLIWWDHDLGDVVIDTISDEGEQSQVPTELEDYDKITDNVYFYYIT
jgi:hypothetical protein